MADVRDVSKKTAALTTQTKTELQYAAVLYIYIHSQYIYIYGIFMYDSIVGIHLFVNQPRMFLQKINIQLMVNWCFGLVVWDSRRTHK